jgi:hypothetical protein
MGPIEYFLIVRTRSVHCQYMPSHMPHYEADPIFVNVPNSICALSIYAQVVYRDLGPIQHFLMDRTRSGHCQYMHKPHPGL